MPIFFAVLITLQAISPRLAISILLNIINVSSGGWASEAKPSSSHPRGSGLAGPTRGAPRGQERSDWGASSQRNIAVLAPRVLELLVAQHHERAADAPACFVRLDHVVDEAARARDERVGEALLVFGLARRQFDRVVLVLAEDDLHRALRAHHRDLGVGPGEVHVASKVLRAHHVV